MLQIVIWGMAIMLVVKALDIAHQESVARKAGTSALVPAIIACVVAVAGALALVILVNGQVAATSPAAALSTLGTMGTSSGKSAAQVEADADAQAKAMEAEADRLDAMAGNVGAAGKK